MASFMCLALMKEQLEDVHRLCSPSAARAEEGLRRVAGIVPAAQSAMVLLVQRLVQAGIQLGPEAWLPNLALTAVMAAESQLTTGTAEDLVRMDAAAAAAAAAQAGQAPGVQQAAFAAPPGVPAATAVEELPPAVPPAAALEQPLPAAAQPHNQLMPVLEAGAGPAFAEQAAEATVEQPAAAPAPAVEAPVGAATEPAAGPADAVPAEPTAAAAEPAEPAEHHQEAVPAAQDGQAASGEAAATAAAPDAAAEEKQQAPAPGGRGGAAEQQAACGATGPAVEGQEQAAAPAPVQKQEVRHQATQPAMVPQAAGLQAAGPAAVSRLLGLPAAMPAAPLRGRSLATAGQLRHFLGNKAPAVLRESLAAIPEDVPAEEALARASEDIPARSALRTAQRLGWEQQGGGAAGDAEEAGTEVEAAGGPGPASEVLRMLRRLNLNVSAAQTTEVGDGQGGMAVHRRAGQRL